MRGRLLEMARGWLCPTHRCIAAALRPSPEPKAAAAADGTQQRTALIWSPTSTPIQSTEQLVG